MRSSSTPKPSPTTSTPTTRSAAKTALAITDNARQIEKLVAEIVQSQTEDIIDIEVTDGEYYLTDLIRRLTATYKEKLALIHTDFQIDAHPNLLLKGDLERLLDVFENLIENAIKYGDGRQIRLAFAREQVREIVSRVWLYVLIGVGIGALIQYNKAFARMLLAGRKLGICSGGSKGFSPMSVKCTPTPNEG